LYYCILSIISRQEVYTSDILEALRKADLLVVEGTLYPLLSRLKICGVDNHRGKAVINVPSLEAINLTGACKAELNVNDSLWAQANGASKIEYQGNPSV
jgi:PadR family transcriptional regulator PadR